jgi:hypothetical protein
MGLWCPSQLALLSLSVLFLLQTVSLAWGFAVPKPDFLLDVAGTSVASDYRTVCVIEEKPGATIGGRIKCYSKDEDHYHRSSDDVSMICLFIKWISVSSINIFSAPAYVTTPF